MKIIIIHVVQENLRLAMNHHLLPIQKNGKNTGAMTLVLIPIRLIHDLE
jgi:hypothetical protein